MLLTVFSFFFFFSSRRRHTRLQGDWSSDVCSSDLRSAGQPVAERIGFLRQAPFLKDRERHRPYAALGSACGQTLPVQPGLELVRRGVGRDGPFEEVSLDRQADRVGGRVALATPASPLGRVEGGEQLAADLAGAGRRVPVHAPRPGEGWSSTILHHLHHPPPSSKTRVSSAYPGRSGRW